MTNRKPLHRAAATAAAVPGACLLALARPAAGTAATTAHANPESTPLNLGGSASAPHAATGGASIVRTIVGLAIVIGVIWGLTWILRQVKAGRDPHVSSSGLASVAALTLSSGRSVHLVRAGSEYVLLGSAEHGVVPIHRYSEEEARDAGLLPAEEADAHSGRSPLQPGDAAGGRYDPTRLASAPSTLVARLRELTVRR